MERSSKQFYTEDFCIHVWYTVPKAHILSLARDADAADERREPERGGWLILPGADSPCTSAVLLPSL